MPISYAHDVTSTPSSASPPVQNQIPQDQTSPIASLQDPNSNPLFVHNANHAGISLVSEKLAGIRNFNTWHRSMVTALGAWNKLVFVNGTFPEIEESHPDFFS